MPKIRVLLADDHAVLRAGLKLLVNHQPDMEVVAEAGTFGEAIRLVSIVKPDVITLDLTMPDGNGVEKIEQVCRACPTARVLVLTMHDDPAYLRRHLALAVSGYVVKKAADTELSGAIARCMRDACLSISNRTGAGRRRHSFQAKSARG